MDILQEGYGSGEPGDLIFPADTPLEISWAATDKLDPVQSSSATLRIISDTDRRFIDLYTVEVGAVRMDVFREGTLYWSGTLDTELYEEPYSTADGYDVSLTFSDFACLDRLDWTGEGLISIHDLVLDCLSKSGINFVALDLSGISTQVNYNTMTLEEVYILQKNFFDEDGEANTAREVLEETLKPFALRIIQKAGKVWIYDLNGLHSRAAEEVEWDGMDAVLSADKIYNNVKVTFSPYGDAEMMKGTVEENPEQTVDVSDGDYPYLHDLKATIKQNYEPDAYGQPSALDGFMLFYDDVETHESNMELDNGARFFQIRSIYSGQDETGVIATYKHGHAAVAEEDGASSKVRHCLNTPMDCGTIAGGNVNTRTIITCPRAFIGNVRHLTKFYRLRINLHLLFDVRYNPFEQEGDYNDNAKWYNGLFNWSSHDGPFQNMQDWCNFGYVPIKLSLVNEAGQALYHYENRAVLDSDGYSQEEARWVAGAASWGQAYLCYYDFDDRKSKTGFGGWKSNKQIIGYYRDALPEKWKTIDDGEYISLPPAGGYLLLEIGEGVHQFDYKREVKDIYKFCRWIAYKEPSITLCKKNYKEADTEDIEDVAWLNRSAKEELTIDTILGTLPQTPHGVPNAKGQLLDNSFDVYSRFTRAGKTDRLERLLIGTVYSQYASRHNILSGTVKLLPAFGICSDAATQGKFILLSEVQNCIEDTSEIAMSEFSEDNYEGIEYQ